MTAATIRASVARGLKLMSHCRAVLALFAVTLFLSAFLLFSVQPIFAKMVLPKLGGTPAVWAVSMCFFQAVLLAGYCYAHALMRIRAQGLVLLAHLALCEIALLLLPFGVPAATEPPPGDAYLWLIGVLAAGVGLPFFAISANAPLLQAWFARSGHPHAADPYFLYGASNLGSLLALLAYPVVLEPTLGLSLQAAAWTGGFLLLVFMLAACGLAGQASSDTAATRLQTEPAPTESPIAWRDRLQWIGLAFVPSGLLVAFTTYMTTDIASAPFLWVIPLALFLSTFVFVFRERPYLPHRLLLLLHPVLVAVALLGLSLVGNRGWLIGMTGGFAAFFVTTMVCHRTLYELRPASRKLTEFYLYMSLGGVLGGVFAAIVAPQFFNALYELPLLLMLGMLCRPGLGAALKDRREISEGATVPALMALLVVALCIGIPLDLVPDPVVTLGVVLVILIGGIQMVATRHKPLRQAAYVSVMVLALLVLPSAMNRGHAERSFFGVHRVLHTTDGNMRVLVHGTTIHGAERIKDKNGRPVRDSMPATYFYPGSPMARGVEAARGATKAGGTGFAAGIVGLGTGSLACYSRPEESWRFFEIDPVVVKIASDARHFSFLSRCRPNPDIVLGDARLTLAKEPAARFDYLVIDAFSSDSVPVHLLTREALTLFIDKLKPNGLLALHISNRHLELASVASATTQSLPGTYTALVDDRPAGEGFDEVSSQVMFVAKSIDALRSVLEWKDAGPGDNGSTAVWTDDFSDVPSAIWRRYGR